ncbi:MAG: hypothetical protein OXT68_09625 [Chloroflexota bacterium]|nr:hypothetical protein [Chloroflexota bacterium]
MQQPLTQIAVGTLLGATLAAAAGYLLAGELPEGAFAGALVGGSIGIIIAMRRADAAGPAFEYEAAGIHDDNLITTARRNLVREAYRDFYNPREIDAAWRAGESERQTWSSGQ